MMLSITATRGRHESSWLNHTVWDSGAPQFLQKSASDTTTGFPHCEQKRGRSMRGSGMESENRVTEPERITMAEYRLGNSLAANPGAVLAPKIAQHEPRISPFDARMMPRDRRIAYHNIIVECTAEPGRRAGSYIEMLSAHGDKVSAPTGGRSRS